MNDDYMKKNNAIICVNNIDKESDCEENKRI